MNTVPVPGRVSLGALLALDLLVASPVSAGASDASYTSDACEGCRVEKISGRHRTLHTQITIDAPPEAVWAVLTDWERLPEWSGSLQGMTGDISDGGSVTVDFVSPSNGKLLVMEHTLTYVEGQSFSWSDPFLAGIYDQHEYRLEPLPDGRTLFIQSDAVRGRALARLLGGTITGLLFDAYQEFNLALKARVEESATPSG